MAHSAGVKAAVAREEDRLEVDPRAEEVEAEAAEAEAMAVVAMEAAVTAEEAMAEASGGTKGAGLQVGETWAPHTRRR